MFGASQRLTPAYQHVSARDLLLNFMAPHEVQINRGVHFGRIFYSHVVCLLSWRGVELQALLASWLRRGRQHFVVQRVLHRPHTLIDRLQLLRRLTK